MRRTTESLTTVEKERIRAEINQQVNDFLQHGGRIDVLSERAKTKGDAKGSVWRSSDTLLDMMD
mgnify:CR=1 FL=1|tara:strand:+ start:106928 stop:107119 length:192 start_codon:yes stop_codon:yes gene_type:complete